MEYEGVRIDTAYLEELGRELSGRIDKLAEKLYDAYEPKCAARSENSRRPPAHYLFAQA